MTSIAVTGQALADSNVVVAVQGEDETKSQAIQARAEKFLGSHGVTVLGAEEGGQADRTIKKVRDRCIPSGEIDADCVKKVLRVALSDLLWLDIKKSADQDNRVVVVISARRFSHDQRGVPGAQRQCVNCENTVEFDDTLDEVIAAAMSVEWTRPDRASDGKTGKPEHGNGQAVADQAWRKDGDAYLSAGVDRSEPGRHFGNWKWVALGSGVALAALGGVAVAIDGPRIDNGVRKQEEFRTLPHGIISSALGALLIGSSIVMYFNDRSYRRKTIEVTYLPGHGVGLSWTQRF
ncbi:MAG: hypothetical protein MJE77_26690 [Proteobacteria bacterium]|nr:hypothetical protein [Pseudomonadota bacterium]